MAEGSPPYASILARTRSVLSTGGRDGLPVITLSWAQTLNAAIAGEKGKPLGISGRESSIMTHALRSLHDGILVGIGTVLSDDPLLTVRLVQGSQPRPIVLDSRLRTPPGARLMTRPDARPWIFHADAEGGGAAALSRAGACLTRVSREGGGLDLMEVCRALSAGGVRSVMVEGGAEVITSFLTAGLFSQVVITVSPVFVDGYLIPPAAVRFGETAWERVGEDAVLWAAR